ncbi:MAG: hypothetical protein ACPLPR_09055 [Bacillota bacterium]
MDKKSVFNEVFTRKVIRLGIATLVAAWLGNFLPCAYLYFRYGIVPDSTTIIKIWALVASVYGAFYIVEPISYYAILGLSGTYMSFLAGNISNLRLPCSAIAQEVTGVEPGTEEAEIISTLGIAGSIIVNTIGVTITAIVGAAILNLFPVYVQKSFSWLLPSIFGAVFVQFAIKYPTIGLLTVPIPLVLLKFVKGLPVWVVIPACVFGAIGIGRLWYNMQGGTRK